MITVSGHQIIETIYVGSKTVIYRGLRIGDQQPIIVKVVNNEYPTLSDIARLKHEYDITQFLNMPGIVKSYCLKNTNGSLALVLEDFGGESLYQYIQVKTLKITEFLIIAIKLADILGELSKNQIIHQDIKPHNIIINSQTGEIKITDFAIASRVSRETQFICNLNRLEGTLAYMSPEQTGRMNRSIDYRTDFYSLGVTFYEMLTQHLPFETNDAMELVHCHIAKQPLPPHELNSDIPETISDIILKLLAKTPEERYQSSYGLRADLQKCLTQLCETNQILYFPLGQQDISPIFQIPQKLYGRDREISTLVNACERVIGRNQESLRLSSPSGYSEMMLISGYSGIGKSALVQEVYQPITKHKGYFIAGKCNLLQRNIPYGSIIPAFQKLIRQLLTESDAQIAVWRAEFLAALSTNCQVIINVIPEIELIVGQQPTIPELGVVESQNRFNKVLQNFIHIFSKPEHPLVIFLDDLQWADSASLKLIQSLMTEADSHYLFLIGAYRDKEVNATHPLMLTFKEIQKHNHKINCSNNLFPKVNHLSLSPLNLAHVTQLIKDTLHCEQLKAIPLAELVVEKTHGNPFFVNEFLKSLYTQELLEFDFVQGVWQWNIVDIQATPITNNVVDLMADKIQRLSTQTQQILKLAACIGYQFDLQTLSIVYKKTAIATASDLWEAIESGLILPLGNEDQLLRAEDWIKQETGTESKFAVSHLPALISYKFLHDRVQQAAYCLIPEDQKQIVHLQLGQLLLKNNQCRREEKIFDIVNQLNFGMQLITNQSEKYELAELNLCAGKKSKLSAAYNSAINYLRNGIKLLSNCSWEEQYELTLALYQEAVEAAYINGEFTEMERYLQIVLQQAKTVLDKVKVYEIKIQFCAARNKMQGTIETTLEILDLLEIRFPQNPSKLDVQQSYTETKYALAGKEPLDLLDLPVMTDPYTIAALRLMSNVTISAYNTAPIIFQLMTLQQVKLLVQYGNSAVAASSYAWYGLFLSGIVDDIDTGYKFGQLALKILDKFDAKEFQAKTFFAFNIFIMPWKMHIKKTLKPLFKSYQIGIEMADFEYAARAALHYGCHSYLAGNPLLETEQEMSKYSHLMLELKQESVLCKNEIIRRSILKLLDRFEPTVGCNCGDFNDEKLLKFLLDANLCHTIFVLAINRLIVSYLLQDFPLVNKYAVLAETYLDSGCAFSLGAIFNFYDSLYQLAIYTEAESDEKIQILEKVHTNQQKMQIWSHYAPMNFLQKYHLVAAERHRVLGEDIQAIDNYNRAIELSREHEYLQEEALANELAAKFYLTKGMTKIAQVYMVDAHYCYQRWGAIAKVRQLEETYPQLLIWQSSSFEKARTSISQTLNRLTTSSTSSSSDSGVAEVLDLATVIKASQAIAGEIVLENLLAKLMAIVIENAGATKGVLILCQNGELWIKAVKEVGSDTVKVLQSLPVDHSDVLPKVIVNYVARTQSDVVLTNATCEGLFIKDIFIKENQPQSVLCTPILNQGKLLGVLYLENHLTTGAFTDNHLEVLKILSSQAAISIENALLYQTLEQKVQERTTQLAQANMDLKKRNLLIRQVFGRYLSDDIVANLLESPERLQLGGDRRKMTILTSDLRGFTAISERSQPEEVISILNIYFEFMADVITKYQGSINEFMGDGILVLFGAPTPREDDALRAVACACAMQLAMDAVNEKLQDLNFPQLDMGIGINTGLVILGNIGSEKRTKYGIVGSQVNLAYRIESYSLGGEILISEQTLQEVGSIVRINGQKQVHPKGVKQLITIYCVDGIGKPYNLFLSTEEEIFFTLTEIIPIQYAMIEEKHINEIMFQGSVIQISEKGAKVYCDHLPEGCLPPAQTNIKLNLLVPNIPAELQEDIYAKVSENLADSRSFYLHFSRKSLALEMMRWAKLSQKIRLFPSSVN
ncbi:MULTISPECIES: AAA family ATPase [unclassified Tolypothrix]|uniref:AAA family ATPase n=1 Tax=unclassified Tolypothrix TaxID=2649714 RepID=UPI0005EAAF86|nr:MULTISPECIES: AAA family ATPase [unclassified Tolypothrix]EKF05717.1 adenylate and Guanylate cyclase catalytic domain protein [Tolypothrix sp. PCC 7601]MBE9084192.1 AAA family ATPase [Tolypothrix sp. LEGE 11397]UYD26572.1 AAA family ATPase [Tolypothrix sp. PCC 7712]UYD31191.1 AAA family ATPase [Tolypothrix sp. PCC 7601]